MATNDSLLISKLKDTIEYQKVCEYKRERLVTAILHNVKYFAKLGEKNALELRDTNDELEDTRKINYKLQVHNKALIIERDHLIKA